MGDTSIEWADKVWNPTRGCSRVSEGCRHCYAERFAGRFSGQGQPYEGLVRLSRKSDLEAMAAKRAGESAPGPRWTGVVRLVPEMLSAPLRWRKPARIFVNSMSDLFHEALSNEDIATIFGVMAAAPRHTFQVLTKRAKRMREWFAWVEATAVLDGNAGAWCVNHLDDEHPDVLGERVILGVPWPLPNVWLGVSVENQAAADERIPDLLATPAALRFLSCEPLLGQLEISVGLGQYVDKHGNWRQGKGLGWIICGCESGPGARPAEVDWYRSLRDQCAAAGVPFFLKQTTDKAAGDHSSVSYPWPQIAAGAGSKRKPGGVIALPYLDGVQHAAFPEPR